MYRKLICILRQTPMKWAEDTYFKTQSRIEKNPHKPLLSFKICKDPASETEELTARLHMIKMMINCC